MALGKPLHLRLFLEGLEVPVIGAQVSMNTNGPSSAAIQVIPLDAVMDLKPRTMVHLFYLDPHIDRDTGERWPYRLLFMGEVHGFGMQQTPMSRACVLQCLDFSSYWDSARATAIEYGPWGNAFTHTASASGGDISAFDNLANHQVERLLSWIGQKPLTPGLQTVGGLAGGIIRMMEAMGGVPGHHKGINDFFTVAQLRCRLLEQITAEENDHTARKLLGNKVLDEWLKNGIQNVSQQVTFRDMMLLLFKYIYYESVPISTPYFTDTKKGDNAWVPGSTASLKEGSTGKTVISNLNQAVSAINSRYGVDRAWSSGLAQVIGETLATCKSSRTSLRSLKLALKGVESDAVKASTELQSAENLLKNLSGSSNFTTDESSGHQDLKQARDHISKAISLVSGSNQKVESSGHYNTKATTQRVRTQVIRPDCWFAVPPVCNVIFPEHYTSLNFDRIWTQETTRTLVLANIALIDRGNPIDNALLARRILAPRVNQETASLVGVTDEQSYRTLMKHEYHVGINVREEWLPDTHSIGGRSNDDVSGQIDGYNADWAQKIALFHFFKYRFAPRQASLGGRFNPYVVCGFPAVVIRRPVLPPTTLDPEATEQEILDALMSQPDYFDVPYQLVGMVAGVNHSIDQSGGVTNVSMHSVRRHSGTDDEFLGLVAGTGKGTVERTVPVSFRYDDVLNSKNEKLLKFLKDITPQGTASPKSKVTGVATEQRSVNSNSSTSGAGGTTQEQRTQTVTRTAETELDDNPLPLYTAKRSLAGISETPVLVPEPSGNVSKGNPGHLPGTVIVGIEVVADETQSTAVVEKVTETGAIERYFSEVIVYEKIKVPVTGTIPVEELIRPGWFSPSYKNNRVGKEIYTPFFGCGSIVDNLEVLGAAQGDATISGDEEVPPVEATDDGTSMVEAVKVSAARAQNLSVEKAINAIAFVYGQVKSDPSLSADDYIDQLTYRPIATMTDIFGDANLHFDSNGEPLPGRGEEGETKEMRVGFHSGSVHPEVVPLKNMKGLMKDPTTGLPRINGVGAKSSIPPELDVRWEKQQQVTAYVAQLVRTKGLPG